MAVEFKPDMINLRLDKQSRIQKARVTCCLVTETTYRYAVWFRSRLGSFAYLFYGILTLNTTPKVCLTRSKDDSFHFSVRTEWCLKLYVDIQVPESVNLLSLSSESGYTLHLNGKIDRNVPTCTNDTKLDQPNLRNVFKENNDQNIQLTKNTSNVPPSQNVNSSYQEQKRNIQKFGNRERDEPLNVEDKNINTTRCDVTADTKQTEDSEKLLKVVLECILTACKQNEDLEELLDFVLECIVIDSKQNEDIEELLNFILECIITYCKQIIDYKELLSNGLEFKMLNKLQRQSSSCTIDIKSQATQQQQGNLLQSSQLRPSPLICNDQNQDRNTFDSNSAMQQSTTEPNTSVNRAKEAQCPLRKPDDSSPITADTTIERNNLTHDSLSKSLEENVYFSEGRRMQNSIPRRYDIPNTWVSQLKRNLRMDGLTLHNNAVRMYFYEFFVSKQYVPRSSIFWTSMHPLVEAEERFLEKNT